MALQQKVLEAKYYQQMQQMKMQNMPPVSGPTITAMTCKACGKQFPVQDHLPGSTLSTVCDECLDFIRERVKERDVVGTRKQAGELLDAYDDA